MLLWRGSLWKSLKVELPKPKPQVLCQPCIWWGDPHHSSQSSLHLPPAYSSFCWLLEQLQDPLIPQFNLQVLCFLCSLFLGAFLVVPMLSVVIPFDLLPSQKTVYATTVSKLVLVDCLSRPPKKGFFFCLFVWKGKWDGKWRRVSR